MIMKNAQNKLNVQRQRERVTIHIPIEVLYENQEIKGDLINLCILGLGIQLPLAIPATKAITVRFTLETLSAKNELVINGTVKHCTQEGQSHLIGIEFPLLSLPDSLAIQSFLNRQAHDASNHTESPA